MKPFRGIAKRLRPKVNHHELNRPSPPSGSRPQTGIITQQRTVAVSGQKSQDVLRRTHGAPQLLPELLSTLKLGRQHLAKGIFESIDSGQKALPGSL